MKNTMIKIGDKVKHIVYPQFFGTIISVDNHRAEFLTDDYKPVIMWIHPKLLEVLK